MQTITLPRKPSRYDAIRYEGGAGASEGTFCIEPARYAKGKYIIHTKGHQGLKSRACRLASNVCGNTYSNRCEGYIASAAQAERFFALYMAGWDGAIMTRALEPPGVNG